MQLRKENPKLFYSFINRAKATRTKIGPLRNGDEVVTDPKQEAELLNDYYASVFTAGEANVPEVTSRNGEAHLETVYITRERIKTIIERMNADSASGPDGITPRVIKELKDEIAEPLESIFRASMECGKIPDEWRNAEVTPIFKKGSKADPGNYRPVSLTNVIGKLMERVVKEDVMGYVEKHSVM